MICEVPDIFSTDLLTLPPKRYVDFVIDVELSTKPISIPPYWIAPRELKELNTQL